MTNTPPADTPEEILVAFQRAIDLLGDIAQLDGPPRGPGSVFQRLLFDAIMRMQQSLTLLTRFRLIDRRSPIHEFGDDLRLCGEAFYYFAWRAREALVSLSRVDNTAQLEFTPRGVLNVRNRMIEHPDNSGGIFILGWTVDCPEGLVLNAEADGLSPDRGLYPNADEFIRKLLRKLAASPLLTRRFSPLSSCQPFDSQEDGRGRE
jgi:hypothetical protein